MENLNWNNKNENLPDDVKKQLENLGLTEKEVMGKVLDIGASKAELEQAFKSNKSTTITSVDQHVDELNKGIVIKADSRNLPFEDGSFDMVISHASIPHIFIDLYSSDFPEHSKTEIESAIKKSLLEIVRVLKEGKKAYMAPVGMAENYESQRITKAAILTSIDYLKELGIIVKFEFIRTYTNPVNNEKSDNYRLILEKPVTKNN